MAPTTATHQLQFVQEPVLSSASEYAVPEDAEHDAQHAGALAVELYSAEREAASLILGVYRPLELPGLHDALGVVARWHTAAQDVDFERRLLLRALLTALPPSVYTLPHACSTLDDLDLAPIKVQPLIEALTARRRIDLGDAEFRWDEAQGAADLAPLVGPWGGADGGAAPAFGGLSKRQLELAAFETLLQALGPSRTLPMEAELEAAAAAAAAVAEEEEQAALVRAIAARLGISGREHRRMLAALRRAGVPGETAAQRCSLPCRLRALQESR